MKYKNYKFILDTNGIVCYNIDTVKKEMPLWWNWQTHLTQNQTENIRAGSSPVSGTICAYNLMVEYRTSNPNVWVQFPLRTPKYSKFILNLGLT